MFNIEYHIATKHQLPRRLLQGGNGSFRRALCPNFNTVYMSACMLNSFPQHTATLSHVKGHQDSNKPFHHLSWPAQLNVTANKEAARYILPQPPPMMPIVPSNQIRLLDSHRQAITKRWNYHLRTIYHAKIYTTWLLSQFHWDRIVLSDIDFEGFHFATRILPSSVQRFVIKWSNQALPVRRHVHRYDSSIPPTTAGAVQVTLKTTSTSFGVLCLSDVMLAPQHWNTFNTSYTYYTRNLRFKHIF